MKMIYLLIFILAFELIRTNLAFRKKASLDFNTLPRYQINLDLPVRDRYKDLFHKFKDNIHKYIAATKASSKFLGFLSIIGGRLLQKHSTNFHQDWLDYLYAITAEANITLGQAVMLSMTYDVGCTSVIVQNSTNHILLGRNLDFGTSEIISKSIFVAEYFRNNKFIYQGIELLGFRGGINAMKPKGFSIAINLRYDKRPNPNFIHLYNAFFKKYNRGQYVYTPNYAIMKAMEHANNFNEAEDILSSIRITSPVYYALSGVNKNEGVIITRSESVIHLKKRLDIDKGIWFLVICNKDLILDKDIRRNFAEENLRRLTRKNINQYSLFNEIMTVYPTLNNITAYTSIQTDNYFETKSWKE